MGKVQRFSRIPIVDRASILPVMGRFLRSRWFPLGLGIVLFLSAVLLRREARPRKPARPRVSGGTVRVASANLGKSGGESLWSSSNYRAIAERAEGGSVPEACESADLMFSVLNGEQVEMYDAALACDQATGFMVEIGWDPLTSDSLEQELELTPSQKTRIDELKARIKPEEELWRSHSLLESEVDRRLEELRERYRDLIRRELSPEQQRTYDKLENESPCKRLLHIAGELERLSEGLEPSEP